MNADPGAYRARIFAAVLPPLEAMPAARGAWEGGSVATGRADTFSDIDLCVVAEPADHDAVLDVVEHALGRAAPIAHVWRVDPQAFAGVTQRIFLLHDAPPFFALDCALLTPQSCAQFLERERHGEPRVLFDRDGSIHALPLDGAAHAGRMQLRLAQIRAAWPVYRSLVEKELARGRAIDAFGFYVNGLMRPLIELVGMRARPARFDFGWRYLHADLPQAQQRELERLAYVDSAESLQRNLATVDRLAAELFATLGGLPPAAQS
jgi:hypothetical protein